MKIIAFIQDPHEIEKIAGNLGYPPWRAPPGVEACAGPSYVDSGSVFNQTLQ